MEQVVGRSGMRQRALIIDRRAVLGTDICRSLARRGCTVDILGEAASPAFHSRFCSRIFRTPPFETGTPFLSVVRDAVRDNHYDAIFVCNEAVLEAIMTLPDYANWPGLVLSSRASLRTALSKIAMMQVAHDAGVAIPRTRYPRDEHELVEVTSEIGFPLVIKGDRGESGNHVRIVDRPINMFTRYREIVELERPNGSSPLVQEYVSGVAYSVGGLFYQGRALRVCAHRKLVAVPPLGGLTVKGVTERCPGLLEEASKIFQALEYTGLGHIELIKDSSNRFNFIEINPRPWGTIGIAEYANVDFATAYLNLARGVIPEPDLRFREGVIFHRIGREGKLIRAQAGRIPGFVRDCLDPRIRSDFEWFDPGPHLAAFTSSGWALWGGGRPTRAFPV
jgi:glutathione synthase/RimK-type ligase-like ATP-grasp enzyme